MSEVCYLCMGTGTITQGPVHGRCATCHGTGWRSGSTGGGGASTELPPLSAGAVTKQAARIAALEAELALEKARLDWLEAELEHEEQALALGLHPAPSLFRANLPITRAAIDEHRLGLGEVR